ncbi:hypothetical protein SETIT_4G121800v2 [Setaria italica]|uniref:Uncharacterized protein n=1 Tax=Setaria italica TaxID=4555 RepID=A0A368QTD4_SETIT|nr:hypothetical protein SETIT_4G121800v2 [Setaria italica]
MIHCWAKAGALRFVSDISTQIFREAGREWISADQNRHAPAPPSDRFSDGRNQMRFSCVVKQIRVPHGSK